MQSGLTNDTARLSQDQFHVMPVQEQRSGPKLAWFISRKCLIYLYVPFSLTL